MNVKVNKKDLRRLCWQKGFHGVSGLARAIRRNRAVVYHALENPTRYRPTIRLIENALL